MLEKLSLKNFQYHKKSELELSKGLNVIYGDNAQGKSCILRALNWVINNRPSGFGFKTRGDGITVTEVDFVIDKHALKRKRNKSANEYRLDKTSFKALRTDIPEEVSNLLNISEYAYRGQHEQYFLFHDSDGEVAKKINKVAGLNQIDNILSKAKSLKDQNNKEAKQLEKEIDFYKTEFNKYKPSVVLQKKVKSFEKEVQLLGSNENTRERLSTALKKISWLKGRVKARKPLTQLLSRLKQCLDDYKKIENSVTRKNTLFSTLKKITRIQTELKTFSKYKNIGSNLQYFYQTINNIEEKQEKVNSLIIKQRKINSLIKNIKKKDSEIKNKKDFTEKTKKIIESTKKKLKVCPICEKKF